MTLEKLYLYAKSNALSEASLTLFLEQPIIKPEQFEILVKESMIDLVQDFKLIYSKTFSFAKGEMPSIKNNATGFQISGYEEGKIRWVIRAKPTEPYSTLSIHCLAYKSWSDYKDVLFFILKNISNLRRDVFVRALSLTFFDQFNWIDKEFPKTDLIFKKSSFLPKSIFNKQNPWSFGLELNQERKVKEDILNYLDKIDVFIRKIENENFNIGLVHNTVYEFQIIDTIDEILNNQSLEEQLDFAHSNNKNIISSILADNVLSKMGLKIKDNA